METAISEAISVTKSGGIVYVAEPLAEGACFELDSPVEDETLVRAQAQRCLNKAIRSDSKFSEDAEERYEVYFDYQNYAIKIYFFKHLLIHFETFILLYFD